MSTPLTGSFVPALVFSSRNSTWPALSANFSSTTAFTFQSTIAPKNFTAPNVGDSFTVSISIFDGKTVTTCKTICWQMISSTIQYASGTMTAALSASSFNKTPINGSISITTLTNETFSFSITGALASTITLPSAHLGQTPVIVQVTLTPTTTPTTWATSYGKCLLTGQFVTTGASTTLSGGIGIANGVSFQIRSTPIPVTGATAFTGSITLQNGASTIATLNFTNGQIRTNNSIYASLIEKNSLFGGVTMKGSFSGSYKSEILTLNLENAQFVTDPSFNLSPMIPTITGTIDITLSAPPKLGAKQGWLSKLIAFIKKLLKGK